MGITRTAGAFSRMATSTGSEGKSGYTSASSAPVRQRRRPSSTSGMCSAMARRTARVCQTKMPEFHRKPRSRKMRARGASGFSTKRSTRCTA